MPTRLRRQSVILLLASGVLLAAAKPGSSLAADGDGDDVVLYTQRLTVSPDGEIREEATGSAFVELRDGTLYAIDPEKLSDPDGGSYYIAGEAYQEAEGDDVVYELRLVQHSPRQRSEEELLAGFREVYPDASAEDVAAFRARRAGGADLPAAGTVPTADTSVGDWLSGASDVATLEVTVVLRDDPALNLPDVSRSLMASDPVFALDQMEARVLAIEERKTVTRASQAELAALVEKGGGLVGYHYWLENAFEAVVTPQVLDVLMARPDVARIEAVPEMGLDSTNYGEEIRDATQISPFLDESLNGELPSGRSAVNDIYIGISDSKIDIDHPAWKDCSTCGSRLVGAWQWNGTAWVADTVGTTSSSHGTAVTGQALADLTQNQDSTYTVSADQLARTGMTTESSFAAIDSYAGGMTRSIEQAITLDVDIVNMSGSWGPGTDCDTEDTLIDAVDDAMKDGIFFVNTPGNNGHVGSSCTVDLPGTASGSFTANDYDVRSVADLNAATIASDACRGGDVHGRAVIDLVAPEGREGAMGAQYNNTYANGGYGTSLAAPVITGAAANFKHHFISVFGTSAANTVGNLYAHMLLMGDGELESGGTATATTPLDNVWGAGRMRMRMFNSAGMDAPWRIRWFNWVLDDGDAATWYVNPDGGGVNQPVSSDAEWFKAALWWHEPNLGASETSADIQTKVCKTGTCYTHSSTNPQAHRLWLGNVLGGQTWEVTVTGLSVPASTDADYYYGQQKRQMFLAFFYEDRDRDDADGPSADIE